MASERVVLKLKTPWRDRTTHLVMSPLEFMQRLAALLPRRAILPIGLHRHSNLSDSFAAIISAQ